MARRGIFLDLDGTLADSLDAMRRAYDRFLAHHGFVGTTAEFQSLNGPPLRVIAERLGERWALPGTTDELTAVYARLIDQSYDEVPAADAADATLAAAKRAGWVVGVVTSNGRARVERWLERTGLAGSVDLVVAGEAVARGKPSPEPYLLALERSGAVPALSLAVEDAPQGAVAALAAGLRTYGIAPPSRPVPAWPQGTLPIGGLGELIPVLEAAAR